MLIKTMAKTKEELRAEVDRVLNEVRPSLLAHGGGVELVDVDPAAGTVMVRLQGACIGCPLSDLTLKAGIQSALCDQIPEIKEVLSVD
ncbi:MAG TPA: NifU family protein [Patescibacteria group bacterium]|nr:NifU family protein [Patescibacteria group bacterium]